jgi:glycosyltransferase involved in cell wall biosynthesis
MRKISIVHIAQSEGAGVTDYIKMLVREMDKNRYDVSIIGSCYYEKERKYFEDNGCKLITLAMEREIKLLKDLGCMLKLRKLIKELKPDILHVHSSKAGVIARIANLGLSSKVIYNAHGWSFNMKVNQKKIYFFACIERILAKFTKVIVNISRDEYETAIKIGIPNHKMVVIQNAIDTKTTY